MVLRTSVPELNPRQGYSFCSRMVLWESKYPKSPEKIIFSKSCAYTLKKCRVRFTPHQGKRSFANHYYYYQTAYLFDFFQLVAPIPG